MVAADIQINFVPGSPGAFSLKFAIVVHCWVTAFSAGEDMHGVNIGLIVDSTNL